MPMFLTYLMLAVALCLSAVAAYYSIVGLTAIFSAAVIPIIVMGSILEVAKLVVTVWLHEYWPRVKFTMRAYMVSAVVALMFITSMGIFGFLSKAHLDQTMPAGDIQAEVQILDEKIQTQRDNIDTARRALQQMDSQVEQMLGRTADDRGAERAVQIRRQQGRERARLQNEIATAQSAITQLQAQRAPKAAEVRKVEAEVGPIRYIAALIYGDNPDANLLERAVRWVIILLVAVFDPLAIMMLLAATESLRWNREDRLKPTEPTMVDASEPNVLPVEEPQSDAPDNTETSLPENIETAQEQTLDPQQDAAEQTPESEPVPEPEPVPDPEPVPEPVDEDPEQETDAHVKESMKLWKQQNPGKTLKEQRHRLAQGLIDKLPWLDLVADNVRPATSGFGTDFPGGAAKGDVFVKTDRVPHVLYKFNGEDWIEVHKDANSSYAYNDAYIQHLIDKLESGEMDPELLNETETEEIARRLSPKA